MIKALLATHPYEEPAFDFYPLKNTWTQVGSGVVGELEEPEAELDFLKRIKKRSKWAVCDILVYPVV